MITIFCKLKHIWAAVIFMAAFLCANTAYGQFMDDGYGSNNGMYGNQNGTYQQDDTSYVAAQRPSFTFKQYFRGLAHKDTIPIAYMWAGSIFLPGSSARRTRGFINSGTAGSRHILRLALTVCCSRIRSSAGWARIS